MTDWQTVSLDQIGRIITGKTPKTSNQNYYGGSIPFVTPSDMVDNRYIQETGRYLTNEGKSSVSNALIPAGAVMVSCIGSDMGKSAIAKHVCVTNQQINSIVTLDSFNSLFIYYNLRKRREEIRNSASGSAQPILNKSAFGRLQIKIPPLAMQNAIAFILGSLDDKIELNRGMNETLEVMARALFRDWFVDFGPTRAKMAGEAPYLAPELWELFPDRLDDEGKPEGWHRVLLNDLISVTKGRSYKSSELQESETALVTLKSFMRGGGYRHDGLKAFTGKYHDDQIVSPGDLIVALTDVTQAADVIGKPAIVVHDQKYKTLVASLDVGIIRKKTELTGMSFIYQILLSEEFQNHAYSYTSGTTVLHLNKEAIPSFEVCIPPQKLGAFLENSLDTMKEKVISNFRFFRTFRDGYLVLRFRNWEIQKVVHFHGYSPVSRLRSLDLPRSLVVRRVVALDNRVEIEVSLRKRSAVCPDCQCPTRRIHSFYQRKLADLPWQGRPATLIVSVPRFFCQTMLCPRRTFVMPLEGITVRHGRQTTRLADLHYYIAHTLGGSAGARMTVRLCCPISADTLVRRLLSRAQNTTKGMARTRVVGVDDWAWRRGHHYGTIVVDLEKNDVIDLLPDRDADTLARWLQVHPGIEIIARDRAGAYADGCRRGAPSALQVTDRWHLLKNLSDAFVSILDRFTTTVRTLTRQLNVSTAVSKISETISAHPEEAQAVVRSASGERRDILFKEALALKAAGHSIQAIATTIGVERKTVRRWFQRGHAPPWKRTVPSRSILVPYTAHLEKRWSEGCRNSRQLWRELLEQGFAGQYGTVWKWVATRQGCSAKPVPSAHVVAPRGRRLARLLLAEDPLSAGQEGLLVPALLEAEPHLAVTLCWLRKMQTLLCKRGDTCTGGDLKALLEEGKTTLLSRLIPALERDAAAIEASLVTPWTTSPVEGQISRLKMIKRTMFGRAGFELLRARVLQPA